ncbi:hypothetical protein [Infirmifilum sp. NZ]|uniref:hypothetical protein n=1 Tax=Infirmifilum sp. NZ TaxID=2926850 RepID=UPI0027A2AD7F|nr:hypothetical protein [Infirmifilum sp. NZ]UNQ73172.1 hypothetical protein MOV14_08680 [Infirmifilum sp. NZ]
MESPVSSNLSEFIGNVRNRYTLRLGVVEIVEAATSIGLHILRERLSEEAEGTYRYLGSSQSVVYCQGMRAGDD